MIFSSRTWTPITGGHASVNPFRVYRDGVFCYSGWEPNGVRLTDFTVPARGLESILCQGLISGGPKARTHTSPGQRPGNPPKYKREKG